MSFVGGMSGVGYQLSGWHEQFKNWSIPIGWGALTQLLHTPYDLMTDIVPVHSHDAVVELAGRNSRASAELKPTHWRHHGCTCRTSWIQDP